MHVTALARVSATLAVAMFSVAEPVFAQGYAIRGGANVNPDQLYGGVQYALSPIWENLRPTPSVDVGFGNDATLIAVNMDLLLHSRALGRRSVWTALLGGGPAINHYRLPFYSQTSVGINAVAALSHTSGWFTEFRLGFLESPDVRFGVGYQWTARPRPSPPRRR